MAQLVSLLRRDVLNGLIKRSKADINTAKMNTALQTRAQTSFEATKFLGSLVPRQDMTGQPRQAKGITQGSNGRIGSIGAPYLGQS